MNTLNTNQNNNLNTNLNNVNFANSKIDNIMLDYYSVKGIIIDRFQSYDLVEMLGVKFND